MTTAILVGFYLAVSTFTFLVTVGCMLAVLGTVAGLWVRYWT